LKRPSSDGRFAAGLPGPCGEKRAEKSRRINVGQQKVLTTEDS
jgi:hypothetical protein